MRQRFLKSLMVVCIVLGLGLSTATLRAQAGEGADQTSSMRESNRMNRMRDAEEKEYRQKSLSNDEEAIALLKEIRDLLKQLNAKK